MVDILVKRAAPAPSPAEYKTLSDWLKAATERHGMASELARYCDVERQNIDKWRTGSLPSGPAVRKAIAEWAQVDYAVLRELIERDEEHRGTAASAAAARKKKPRVSLARNR